MSKNKLCCRIFPIVVLFVSVLISLAIRYFTVGEKVFDVLRNWGEFINFMGVVLFVAILPIGIFYWLNDKEKYEDKARQLALLGFLPALVILLIVVAWSYFRWSIVESVNFYFYSVLDLLCFVAFLVPVNNNYI